MKLQVFGIFDVKAGYYKHTFVYLSKGEGLRTFIDLAKDQQTEVGKHPEDFCLFHLAEYDNVSGTWENKKAPESMGLAIEYLQVNAAPEQLTIPGTK